MEKGVGKDGASAVHSGWDGKVYWCPWGGGLGHGDGVGTETESGLGGGGGSEWGLQKDSRTWVVQVEGKSCCCWWFSCKTKYGQLVSLEPLKSNSSCLIGNASFRNSDFQKKVLVNKEDSVLLYYGNRDLSPSQSEPLPWLWPCLRSRNPLFWHLVSRRW